MPHFLPPPSTPATFARLSAMIHVIRRADVECPVWASEPRRALWGLRWVDLLWVRELTMAECLENEVPS